MAKNPGSEVDLLSGDRLRVQALRDEISFRMECPFFSAQFVTVTYQHHCSSRWKHDRWNLRVRLSSMQLKSSGCWFLQLTQMLTKFSLQLKRSLKLLETGRDWKQSWGDLEKNILRMRTQHKSLSESCVSFSSIFSRVARVRKLRQHLNWYGNWVCCDSGGGYISSLWTTSRGFHFLIGKWCYSERPIECVGSKLERANPGSGRRGVCAMGWMAWSSSEC